MEHSNMTRILLLVFLSFNISNGIEDESPKCTSKVSKHYNYDQELRECIVLYKKILYLACYICGGVS